MLTETLIKLFTRDLNALKSEINLYSNEKALWLVPEGISNSAGNLCLHLVGNLNHFIGSVLGNTGYVRQRDLEFSLTHFPKEALLQQVDDTIQIVSSVLKDLTEEQLQQDYKHQVFNVPMTTEYFLMHLTTHLAYHLGQINYHRRFLESK